MNVHIVRYDDVKELYWDVFKMLVMIRSEMDRAQDIAFGIFLFRKFRVGEEVGDSAGLFGR